LEVIPPFSLPGPARAITSGTYVFGSYERIVAVVATAVCTGSSLTTELEWAHNGVVFATLHIVGSDNAQAAFQPGSSAVRTQADDDEVVRRNAANLAWLNATFDQAERDGAPGVLIMIQANPGLEFRQDGADRTGYEDFLALLESRVAAYGRPVVLAHGDSHFFRIDKPRLLNLAFLPNFTRIETFGAGNVHWVRVQVDPRSEQVFRFEQEIIEENR